MQRKGIKLPQQTHVPQLKLRMEISRTARNEALLEAVILRTKDAPYPCLIACDAKMEPDACVQGKWFYERTMINRAPTADVSTCKSKNPDEVEAEHTYEYVVACKDFRFKIQKVDVFDGYDPNPHKPVRFEVRCKKHGDLEGPEAVARCQWRQSTLNGGQYAKCQKCDKQTRSATNSNRGM